MLGICPAAQIIDLAHDITGFNIREGARLFEAVAYLPVGCHVCVVDPGVGTARRGIVVQVGRGDFLIGPDNGVLLPATRFLGGITGAHELRSERYRRTPVSPIFHGRDVFAPAAAHLARGVGIHAFGPSIDALDLHPAAYEEASVGDGSIAAQVVQVNHFGSVFLNVMQGQMHALFSLNDRVQLRCHGKQIIVPYGRTFGDVGVGSDVILDDDFGRVEVAVNQGSFAAKYGIQPGDAIELKTVD